MKVLLFDMGLPMIIPSIFLMVVALVPIVLIEAYLAGSTLRMKTKEILLSVTIANAISTFIGIPVTWFLLAVLEFASVSMLGAITNRNPWTDLFSVTLGAPWVAPGGENEKWVVLGAMLFLLVPYGLASWAVEYLVIKTRFARKSGPPVPIGNLKLAVGKANLISYSLLAICVILVWGVSLVRSN
jgi:hypothetical protein